MADADGFLYQTLCVLTIVNPYAPTEFLWHIPGLFLFFHLFFVIRLNQNVQKILQMLKLSALTKHNQKD